MSATLTIAKRELRANFDSPVAYVVICLSLIALGFTFFYYEGGFWQANRASFEMLFVYLPRGLSWVVIPVLTMRLIAEERRAGTLEMLITLPVKDHQVVLGKFLGTWVVVLGLIASTLLFPVLMFKFWHLGTLDWGPIFAGYIGLVFYSAAAVSLGLLVSSLTESQIIAFFITWLLLLVLHISGMFMNRVDDPSLQQILAFISFDARLVSFSRGLVTTRDLLYFASIAAMSLMASFRALERRKWS
jgi:ABC-2 type transport system permease protein